MGKKLALGLVCLTLAAAAPGAAAVRGSFVLAPSVEQEREVKDAVGRLKAAGLPAPLPTDPGVDAWERVLVSDAVSVVELAHVDFGARVFYLSVQNPWTGVVAWYGPFNLDEAAPQHAP